VAGLPVPLPSLRRMAELVWWSARLQTFLPVLNFHPLSGYLLEMMAFSPSYCIQYSKLYAVKTTGTHEKLTPFDDNCTKIDRYTVCGYELPTNLRNFTHKDLTEVKIFQKVLEGYFFETPCRHVQY